MKVSYLQYETEVRKLPISLYLGSGIDLKLVNNDGDEAFFDPFSRVITLNYKPMSHHFDKMEEVDDVVKYIRSDLYHEVSHVFMTPNNLYAYHNSTPYDNSKIRSALNVFEDERMETILSTFYYGVNFLESIIIMNDYHGEDASCAREDFYFTVRFRHGKEKFVKRVGEIIHKYPKEEYNANTNGYYEGEEYKNEIIKLMEDIYRDWYETNMMDKILKEEPNYNSFNIPSKNRVIADLDRKLNPPQFKPGSGSGDGDGPSIKVYIGETEFDPEDGKEAEGGQPTEGEAKDPKGKPTPGSSDQAIKDKEQWVETYPEYVDPNKTKKDIQKMLETKMNKFKNPQLTKDIDEIFAEFNQKTKNTESAAQRYSGKFNPREVGRKDWRVWTYKDEHGPVRGYDKLHMNLFIDTSGSFCHNEDKVNTLLRSLIDLEKKYKFFYFDLVTCQVGETLRTRDERYIECGGGNDLDDDVWDIYKKLQDPMSFNVNIALFDGGAFTDARGYSHQKNFGVFNNERNSIISDTDNKDAITKFSPKSHNIFVPRSGSTTYPSLLFENIVKSINVALKS